jgi:hypothetical protein
MRRITTLLDLSARRNYHHQEHLHFYRFERHIALICFRVNYHVHHAIE